MHSSLKFIAATAIIAFTCSTFAQTPSSSLGIVAAPAKGQSTEQQSLDEKECFNTTKTQTGFDPANPSASVSTQVEQAGGQRVRGAARGAAAGAVIGEVADDDSRKGAEVGAAVGVVKGGADKRRAKEEAEKQQQQLIQEKSSFFNKSYSSCLETKGYTIK